MTLLCSFRCLDLHGEVNQHQSCFVHVSNVQMTRTLFELGFSRWSIYCSQLNYPRLLINSQKRQLSQTLIIFELRLQTHTLVDPPSCTLAVTEQRV